MSVYINNVLSIIARLAHSVLHSAGAAPALRMRRRNMICVAGGAVAADLAVYFSAAGPGVLIFLQHKSRRPFSYYKSASAPVKGQGRGVCIL